MYTRESKEQRAKKNMIISASRRTDIPAFYGQWFMNRIRAGYCRVANPVNRSAVTTVSLQPGDVDLIVFWSKDPAPLAPSLPELDSRGFRYCFLFTLNDYSKALEPCVPSRADRIATFRALARRIGGGRMVWRYDPIVLSRDLDVVFHKRIFSNLARALSGFTERVIISVVDFYGKTRRRLAEVERRTGDRFCPEPFHTSGLEDLIGSLARTAGEHGMEIQSCAEDERLESLGVKPGKCIDDEWIRKVFGITVAHAKDPGQRALCGCVASKDIGAPDSCAHGCEYCYATRSHLVAVARHSGHDPAAPSL